MKNRGNIEKIVFEYLNEIGYLSYKRAFGKNPGLKISYDEKKKIYSVGIEGDFLSKFYLNKNLKPTRIVKTFREYKKRTKEYLDSNLHEVEGRIRPVVFKLNSNPDLGIMESCEGHVNEYENFAYGATWINYFYLEKSKKAQEFNQKLRDYFLDFKPETSSRFIKRYGKPEAEYYLKKYDKESVCSLEWDLYFSSDRAEDLHYFANRLGFGIIPAGLMFGGAVHIDRKKDLEHNFDLFWKGIGKIL